MENKNNIKIKNKHCLIGEIIVSGDKSISHRAIMLGALAKGRTVIKGFLNSEDCKNTIKCFSQMGVDITETNNEIIINGSGLTGLKESKNVLDVGNSGTAIRLITGVLAGQKFSSKISGDSSIQTRPMARIIKPLTQMGAEIKGVGEKQCPLLEITGNKKIKGIEYELSVASAQVKSCILLAGLFAQGVTTVIEPVQTRNHTELMMEQFGVEIINEILEKGKRISIKGSSELKGTDIEIPGDISSAAFFIVAGLIIPDSDILIKNIGNNPTRNKIVDVLKNMGGNIEILNKREYGKELVCDIRVKYSNLKGINIGGDIIPNIIDEIPILCIAGAYAEGITEISGAQELRVKESDRISTMAQALTAVGVEVAEKEDGLIINGGKELSSGVINSNGDHRIVMAMAIAGAASKETLEIIDIDCVKTSFPDFFNILEEL
jgi:3-phosphoshikimate 1-carboxyvinyltransferase